MRIRDIIGLSVLIATLGYSQPAIPEAIMRSGTHPSYVEERRPNLAECEQLLERTLTLEEQAKKLNEEQEYGLTGKDLALITRVVYMEAANDPKAKSEEERRRGWEGVASVIRNRYFFDKNHETHLFGKRGLEGVVRAPWQFHPVSFFPYLFAKSTLQDAKGEPRVAYGKINPTLAGEVYNTVVEVLAHPQKDITEGAVFFHADYVQRGRRNGTTAFQVDGNACKTIFTTQINTHRFFATSCAIDPYGESKVFENPT